MESTGGLTGPQTYGLPASVIPPFWHHHPELVWERPHCTCTGSAPTTQNKTDQHHWVAP